MRCLTTAVAAACLRGANTRPPNRCRRHAQGKQGRFRRTCSENGDYSAAG